jgi:hypothetical protein
MQVFSQFNIPIVVGYSKMMKAAAVRVIPVQDIMGIYINTLGDPHKPLLDTALIVAKLILKFFMGAVARESVEQKLFSQLIAASQNRSGFLFAQKKFVPALFSRS